MKTYLYDKKHKEKVKTLLYARYGKVCVRCGATSDLTLDHVYPAVRTFARRQVNEWKDALLFPKKYFQILCRACNAVKGSLTRVLKYGVRQYLPNGNWNPEYGKRRKYANLP